MARAKRRGKGREDAKLTVEITYANNQRDASGPE